MEPRALDGGARSFLFLLCTYVFYNLPVSRFGYREANGNEAQQIQNKQVDNSSQPGPKPKTTTRQEYVFSNLPVSGIQRQTEMKNIKFKTNKLTTAAWTKQSQKRQDFKKGFLWYGSDGVDHVAREVLQHGVANRGSPDSRALSKSMDQHGKVVNPACDELNRENDNFLVPVRALSCGLARRVQQSRPASAYSFPYSG